MGKVFVNKKTGRQMAVSDISKFKKDDKTFCNAYFEISCKGTIKLSWTEGSDAIFLSMVENFGDKFNGE